MGFRLERWVRVCCVGSTVAFVAACSGGDSHRKARIVMPADAGIDAAAPLGDGSVSGKLQYFGSAGPAGGSVMSSNKYILFSVTGEVPGTSGLTHSPKYEMVGGVLSRAH